LLSTDLKNSTVDEVAAVTMSDHDVYLFKEGSHGRLYEKLGSHPGTMDGADGTWFGVWAPNAARVSVIGDFNDWNRDRNSLQVRQDGSGIWEGFVPGAAHGNCYKYFIESRHGGTLLEKGDPFAFAWEAPPQTASRIWSLKYDWQDADWMATRSSANALNAPFSVYEVHLGSWMRPSDNAAGYLTYREMAQRLAAYVQKTGFTHVELMPVTEHPFYGSWGYQTTGYFAPTARYGTPEDFMYFVDHLHQCGIGVILDWVPSHFPGDAHGLVNFDGTALYEHADPKEGFHPEWQSYIFNYGRNEVRGFLTSSALFWLDKYHLDGIRVDAVASMLYRDYGRKAGEWVPNKFGGHENLEAVSFLRELNAAAYREHPDTQMIAEESTAWPGVSRPVYTGGLGFGMKWNMGWMHDTLAFFSQDPVNRKYHQGQLVFSLWYAFTENFMLSLSHDEVVYGKRSLLEKMPGDEWQKFANMRLLFGYMWAHPGKKLVFMGNEIGQRTEWAHDGAVDWSTLERQPHESLQRWVEDLNRTYRENDALHQVDFTADGFEWIDASDTQQNVVAFLRKGDATASPIVVVCNFTPIPRYNYAIGVPAGGRWVEILNSDATLYGGSGQGNMGGVEAAPVPAHGRMQSISLTLPPLSVLYFRRGS
jgi:1,4-alpha-glucan branching enzyme